MANRPSDRCVLCGEEMPSRKFESRLTHAGRGLMAAVISGFPRNLLVIDIIDVGFVRARPAIATTIGADAGASRVYKFVPATALACRSDPTPE